MATDEKCESGEKKIERLEVVKTKKPKTVQEIIDWGIEGLASLEERIKEK